MKINKTLKQIGSIGELTEALLDEVVKGVTIAVVSELVVARGEFLEALSGDGGEVAREFRVLGEDHGSTSHKAVDQRLLPHRRRPSSETLAQTLDFSMDW